jgi:hypothetical protein
MSRHTITVTCDHGGGGAPGGLVVAVIAGVALLGSGAVAAIVSAIVAALLIGAVVLVVLAVAVVLAVVVVKRRRARSGPSAVLAPYWRPELSPAPRPPRQLATPRVIPGRALPAARPACQARPRDRRRNGGTPC